MSCKAVSFFVLMHAKPTKRRICQNIIFINTFYEIVEVLFSRFLPSTKAWSALNVVHLGWLEELFGYKLDISCRPLINRTLTAFGVYRSS